MPSLSIYLKLQMGRKNIGNVQMPSDQFRKSMGNASVDQYRKNIGMYSCSKDLLVLVNAL